ncbi:E3 ubiquitin-protein ligase UPL6-like isoform X3 [Gossypium australe]|uniref:E3 ubiquitin-protein ligase UPL6-like isoform X3 n=1 Tax=Gossypium australe TaxID=47621 RepID=A0A5B6VKG8_9ROSI|nr:E3 ubiquitin-protein ligase UPL6-like isoform X3 [Gossypium australe]
MLLIHDFYCNWEAVLTLSMKMTLAILMNLVFYFQYQRKGSKFDLSEQTNVLFGGISAASDPHNEGPDDKEVAAVTAACAFLHVTFNTLPLERIMIWRMDAVETRELAGKKAKLAVAELAKLSRCVCADNKEGWSFIPFVTTKDALDSRNCDEIRILMTFLTALSKMASDFTAMSSVGSFVAPNVIATKDEALWVQVFKSKYGMKERLLESITRGKCPAVWRALAKTYLEYGFLKTLLKELLAFLPYPSTGSNRINWIGTSQSNGQWITGYNKYLGFCSIFDVELWEILDGLVFIQREGHKSVLIHTDNLEVVKALQDIHSAEANSTLVKRIHMTLQTIEQ